MTTFSKEEAQRKLDEAKKMVGGDVDAVEWVGFRALLLGVEIETMGRKTGIKSTLGVVGAEVLGIPVIELLNFIGNTRVGVQERIKEGKAVACAIIEG